MPIALGQNTMRDALEGGFDFATIRPAYQGVTLLSLESGRRPGDTLRRVQLLPQLVHQLQLGLQIVDV